MIVQTRRSVDLEYGTAAVLQSPVRIRGHEVDTGQSKPCQRNRPSRGPHDGGSQASALVALSARAFSPTVPLTTTRWPRSGTDRDDHPPARKAREVSTSTRRSLATSSDPAWSRRRFSALINSISEERPSPSTRGTSPRDHVDQFAVEEEQPILPALNRPFDQDVVIEGSGRQPRPTEVIGRLDTTGDPSPTPGAIGGLDDTGSPLEEVHCPLAGRQIHQAVVRHWNAIGLEQPVDGRLVERQRNGRRMICHHEMKRTMVSTPSRWIERNSPPSSSMRAPTASAASPQIRRYSAACRSKEQSFVAPVDRSPANLLDPSRHRRPGSDRAAPRAPRRAFRNAPARRVPAQSQ